MGRFWWELAIGVGIVLLAAVTLIASRFPRFRVAHAIVAVRIASLVLVVLGAALVVRSFRTA